MFGHLFELMLPASVAHRCAFWTSSSCIDFCILFTLFHTLASTRDDRHATNQDTLAMLKADGISHHDAFGRCQTMWAEKKAVKSNPMYDPKV